MTRYEVNIPDAQRPRTWWQDAYRAWVIPGPSPSYHQKMQAEVRRAMPILAQALDRAVTENARRQR